MRQNTLLSLPLLLLSGLAAAQPARREQRIGVTAHLGSFITKMSKAEVAKDSYSFLAQAEWSRNSAFAPNTWLGATFLHGNSGGRQYLGTVSALMAFGDQPVVRIGWWTVRARMALGLGWIQKPYDPVTNHKNTLLGSHLNAAVQASLYQQVRLGKNWSWNSGVSFLHLSNGTSTLPNLGLNIPCFYTGVSWHRDGGPLAARRAPFEGGRRNQWSVWATAGLKQWPLVNSPRTVTQVFSAEWARPAGSNGRWGATVQVFHDPSRISPSDTVQIAPKGGGWQIGAGAHYTVVIGRWELPLQMGAYLSNPRDGNSVFQTLGIRYRASRHWLAGIHLKTHMGKADYLHAGIGYQW